MKTLPVLLAADYAVGTLHLGYLLKITRKDGVIFALTSASEDVTIAGQLYGAAQGLIVENLASSVGMSVDNTELTTFDDGSMFTRADILSRVWTNADFLISKYNYLVPSNGTDPQFSGTFGNVSINGKNITVELRGLQQKGAQPIGSVVSKTCRDRLGGRRCKVNLVPYTFGHTVTEVTSTQVFKGTAPVGDPSFSSVKSLMHFNGADASTTFTDVIGLTWTANGAAQIDTAQSKFGGASGAFDGSTAYLSTPASTSLQFPADLTFECWIRLSAYSVSYGGGYYAEVMSCYQVAGFPNDGYQFRIDGNASAWTSFVVYTGAHSLIYSHTFALNTWYHLAFSRASGVARAFVDGTQIGSSLSNSDAFVPTVPGPVWIGKLNIGGIAAWFPGWIDDLRITKGVARYTANFAVPTAAFEDSYTLAGTFADDYYGEGDVLFTSGECEGLQMKVKTYLNTGGFTLMLPMFKLIQVGDTFDAVAGCRKRHARTLANPSGVSDCIDKFNNILNFDGEPHGRGQDVLTAPPA